MNASQKRRERASGGRRAPSAVACRRHAEPPRRRPRRAGACQRQRTRRPLRAGARRAWRGDPPQREPGCAVGARDGGAVRQDRRRAGAQAEGLVQHHRLDDRFRRRLLAAHAGLRRVRRGARDRAAGGHPRRRVREGRLGRSASSRPTRRGRPRDGAYVRVSFKPDATAAAITAFLNDNKAVVVGGPQAGFFRLRVADKPMSKEELGAVVKKLAANPVVSFTVPAAQ